MDSIQYNLDQNINPLEQSWALEMLNNPEIKLVNLMGPAGTGKTLLALASGLEQTVHEELYCPRLYITYKY